MVSWPWEVSPTGQVWGLVTVVVTLLCLFLIHLSNKQRASTECYIMLTFKLWNLKLWHNVCWYFVLSSMNWKKVKELIHVTHVSILHQLFSELQFKNNILKYQYILLSVKIVLGKFLHVLLFIEHCDIYKSASIGNDKHFDL